MKALAFGASAVFMFVITVSIPARAQEAPPPPDTGVDVTDRDRTMASFVREAATVGNGNLRVEVQGFYLDGVDDPELDLRGFPLNEVSQQQGSAVTGINGGFVNLLGSYGLGNTGEVGVGIPILWQTLDFQSCSGVDGEPAGPCSQDDSGIGDMLLYVKAKYRVAAHCNIGAGVELTPPTGSERKDLGTGELGVNPFVSTRYQYDRIAVGLNVGYNFYTGDVDNVLNYGGQLIVRPMDLFFLRGEIVGRNFNAFGEKFNDVNSVFGVDFNVNEYITIRPTAIVNITGGSNDWGVGGGIVGQFPVLQ